MLHVSAEQVEELERAQLARIEHDIIGVLRNNHPVQVTALGVATVGKFVRDHVNAARSCAMTTPEQIHEFVQLAFLIVHVDADPSGPARFAGIMLTEHTARARLAFAAESRMAD